MCRTFKSRTVAAYRNFLSILAVKPTRKKEERKKDVFISLKCAHNMFFVVSQSSCRLAESRISSSIRFNGEKFHSHSEIDDGLEWSSCFGVQYGEKFNDNRSRLFALCIHLKQSII